MTNPASQAAREACEHSFDAINQWQTVCRKCGIDMDALASAPAMRECTNDPCIASPPARGEVGYWVELYRRLAEEHGVLAVRLEEHEAALRPTAREVEKLRELSEKATAGVWFVEDMSVCAPDDQTESPWEIVIGSTDCGWDRDHAADNIAFIVAAVNYVRTLLSPNHPERAKEGGGK